MPELLILLLAICAVLLWFNGMWDAFCIGETDPGWSRSRSNYGVVKFILTSVVIGWGIYLFIIFAQSQQRGQYGY